MSDDTPRLKLGQMADAQELDAMAVNDALIQLDAVSGVYLLSQSVTAPPGSPADGDMYLLGATPTGAWSGYAHKLAYCIDGGWRFYAPFAGLGAYIADENRLVGYTGSAWVDTASLMSFQNLPLMGINASADTTNRLAVKSAALLFDNVGNGVQAKLNKHAGTDTASLLYQDNYSGRAELGLCGDDDFHFKTSPDGSTWREAVTLKAGSGWVGINTTQPAAALELHVDGGVTAAGLLSADDLVVSKESSAASFAGVVASDVNRRMVFKGTRARGGLAAPTAVAAGDWTFSLLGSGYDGATTRATAGISFLVDGGVSSGVVPQRIIFETGTAASRAERARINASGEMGVGKTATAGVLLDVNGPVGIAGYVVAALPSAAQAGQLIYVSNESGGAVIAFSDGSNWRRVTDRAVVS